MLAHYHGKTWNASEFGRAFGVADTTVRGYLDCLRICSLYRDERGISGIVIVRVDPLLLGFIQRVEHTSALE